MSFTEINVISYKMIFIEMTFLFLLRYYAVTAPIRYSQHRDNHARAYVFIVVCWACSLAIGGFV